MKITETQLKPQHISSSFWGRLSKPHKYPIQSSPHCVCKCAHLQRDSGHLYMSENMVYISQRAQVCNWHVCISETESCMSQLVMSSHVAHESDMFLLVVYKVLLRHNQIQTPHSMSPQSIKHCEDWKHSVWIRGPKQLPRHARNGKNFMGKYGRVIACMWKVNPI